MSVETFTKGMVETTGSTRSQKHGLLNEFAVSATYMMIELGLIFIIGLTIAEYYVANILGETDYYAVYIIPLLLAPLLLGYNFAKNGLYQVANLKKPKSITLNLLKATAISFILVIVLTFVVGIASEYSRLWFGIWSIGTLATIGILRSLVAKIVTRIPHLDFKTQKAAILGDTDAVQNAITMINAENTNTEIVGAFDMDSDQENLNNLIKLCQQNQIERVIIAKNSIVKNEISLLLKTLSILPCEVSIFPAVFGGAGTVSVGADTSIPGLIRIQSKPISELGLFIKSTADKLIAGMGLVALSPLLLLVALAIKLDSSGPVFFRQIRHGYNQCEIKVWKFRTMTVMENGSEFKQATKNDARITRIGNFLRRTSIDELPQLFNVLAGEMSIVGPRPHPVALNDDYSIRLQHYHNRHKVKPGITGWAQINGYRGPTDEPGQMDKRVQYDLEYIENWSFWFDMKIILATPYYGLISKNAF